MGITFTPFALISGTLFIAALYLIWFGVTRKKYWISITVTTLMLIFIVFKPIRMTTDTVAYNARVDDQIMQDHAATLRELPPKVESIDQSYDEYLTIQNKLLTKPEEKKQ